MFLGTAKGWWLLTILLVAAGLIYSGRNFLVGVLILLLGMVVFSVAPRKRSAPPEINLGNLQIVQQIKGAVNSVAANAAPPANPGPVKPAARPAPPRPVMRPAPELKPREKIDIDGRDASDV
jgi:hypothetical protein